MKKALAMLLALLVLSTTFVGCGKKNASTEISNLVDVDYKFNEEADKYNDISDMPDWEGQMLDLQMWYGKGSYAAEKNNIAKNDVVWPELQRVTGVRFTADSFDNNGETQDAKIAKVIATDSWPAIIKGNQEHITEMMIDEDMLWDLTDLIPKYMPHLNALMQKGDFLKSTREDGKIYEIKLAPNITYAYPDMDPELIARKTMPASDRSYVFVRDDILKMIKPEAYTQKELVEIFEKNGKFTEEEILNGAFNSKEEFFDFLRAVKELELKSGNRKVYATYALSGSDNWDFVTYLAGGLNGYNVIAGTGNNYFSYFDVETEKVEYMFKQKHFKNILKELTELVQEDVISSDSLVDNRASYEEKCATGQYAVLYGGTMPNLTTLNQNVEEYGYQYRKVILNIPYNTNKYLPMKNTLGGGDSYAFVKSKISAEQLPQILRFFDFMLTDVGQKVVQWGPKSAGLFKETENGSRRYTIPELEEAMVRAGDRQPVYDYGLANSTWPPTPAVANKWAPIYLYDFESSTELMENFYTTGMFEPQEVFHGTDPSVYRFTAFVEETNTFWNARTAFETALTKIFTAKNDAEFEQLYGNMVSIAERNGLTDATLEKMNDAWVNNVNKDYMHNVYDHIKKVK